MSKPSLQRHKKSYSAASPSLPLQTALSIPRQLAELVTLAEELQAQGDIEAATQAYQRWLTQRKRSSMAWAAYFNLGLLLKEQGDLQGATEALQASLRMQPKFNAARTALQSLQMQKFTSKSAKVELFKILHSDNDLDSIDSSMGILDNRSNPHPDWQDYLAIRQYFLQNNFKDENYYGFFTPDFKEKIKLNGDEIIEFIKKSPNADVFIFSPYADMGAFFLNVFEQGEAFDPGFLSTCEYFLKHINYSTNLKTLVMDVRHTVFGNFFIARGSFWRQWISILEKIISLAEEEKDVLTSRKTSLMERMASLLLTTGNWSCAAYSSYRCDWSPHPTNQLRQEAIMANSLKLSFNIMKDNNYLISYIELRDKIFQ